MICIISYVCLSANFLDKIKLIVPLSFSFCLLVYIASVDFNGLKRAVYKSQLLLGFVCLVSIAILRTNLPDQTTLAVAYKFLTLFVFYFNTIYILTALISDESYRRILKLILFPFFVFGCLNIFFYIVGIGNEVSEIPSVLAQLMGLPINRTKMFLVSGINSYGVVNGFSLAVALLCFYFKVFKPKTSIIYIVVFFIIAVLTDSRGAIIFALISIILSVLMNNRRRFISLKLLPIVLIFAPILLVLLLPQIASSSFFTNVSRDGNDIASGNARFIIWGLVGNDFVNGTTLTFFGLGEGGIYRSDSLISLTILFEGLEDSAGKVLLHPHNSLIAMILDYGILTLLSFISLLVVGIKGLIKNWNVNYKLYTISSAMLIYLILIGSTESFIGFYYQNVIIVYLFVLCLLFALSSMKPVSKNIV